MTTPEADREATAFLQMARKLRYAHDDREKIAGPYRERYDRSQDDLSALESLCSDLSYASALESEYLSCP
jgi:hypothetical protein